MLNINNGIGKLAESTIQKILLGVAHGKQDEVDDLLKELSPESKATFLLQADAFTDYSGRTFHCSAYEYAYWAKDRHMYRMLETHMDKHTKAMMFERIDTIERDGLPHQQHGQAIKGSKHFDMTPLITAYKQYFEANDNWHRDLYTKWECAPFWLAVGRAQRDLPVHVINEYCNPNRSFRQLPTFKESDLPRVLKYSLPREYFQKYNQEPKCNALFPLVISESSGLGVDFTLIRGDGAHDNQKYAYSCSSGNSQFVLNDLQAIRHLDAVRTAELMESQEILLSMAQELSSGLQPLYLLRSVARGKQYEVNDLLTKLSSESKAALLLHADTFIDYSGRTFNCTAYEYAYWAKDTRMCLMLETHMDQPTKAMMLERIDAIERDGLPHQQHGQVVKPSKHFEMDILIMTYDQYIQAKDDLRVNEVNVNYDKVDMKWLAIGKAQRDLPAHVIDEYYNPRRPLCSVSKFKEDKLLGVLAYPSYKASERNTLFPLSVSEYSGLGVNFILGRAGKEIWSSWMSPLELEMDLQALYHLDEARTYVLTRLMGRPHAERPCVIPKLTRSLNFIDKLADDTIQKIANDYLSTADRSALARTTKANLGLLKPELQLSNLLLGVAHGKQDEVDGLLKTLSSESKATLFLLKAGTFTDYSGRTFNCTAYEYAYWAKDKHMCRMLERHMDGEAKTHLLKKVNEIEDSGLAYQQHGRFYKNAHYDMSFILKDLNVAEFHQLKTMTGQSNSKIQQATADCYQNLSFTATEYEALKKILEQRRTRDNSSFFGTPPVKVLSEKLQFDFHSLITALDVYTTHYDTWDTSQRKEAFMAIGKAQRDVPAHVAQEYCRPDRAFQPLPSFNEENLPRTLTFNNYVWGNLPVWFPLASLSTFGLGFNFAVDKSYNTAQAQVGWREPTEMLIDLEAVRHLDEVRIADLAVSREILRSIEGPSNEAKITDLTVSQKILRSINGPSQGTCIMS